MIAVNAGVATADSLYWCLQVRVQWDRATTAVDARATTLSCASVRAASRALDVNTVLRETSPPLTQPPLSLS